MGIRDRPSIRTGTEREPDNESVSSGNARAMRLSAAAAGRRSKD